MIFKKVYWPSYGSWLLKAMIVALCALMLPAGYAAVSAHEIQPTKSEPADGEVLPLPPAKVSVWFEEEVVADKSALKVFDSQGREVDSGGGGVDLTDASHQVLVVGLPALPQGVYTVKWSIGLEDGDSSEGSFNFGVGRVTVPTTAPQPTRAAAMETVAGTPDGNQASLIWFVGGAVLLVAVILFFIVRRRGAP